MKSPDRDAADELVERFKDRIFAARDHGEIYVSIRSHVAIDLLALLFSRASELATLRRRVDHEHQLFAQASGDYDRVSALLEDLFAMVQGECPSLLRDHHLFDKIKAALPPGRNEG